MLRVRTRPLADDMQPRSIEAQAAPGPELAPGIRAGRAIVPYVCHVQAILMMREVKPLSDRQWAMVIEQLREGPTPEMMRTLKMARERAKDIKEISHEEVERRRRRAAEES